MLQVRQALWRASREDDLHMRLAHFRQEQTTHSSGGQGEIKELENFTHILGVKSVAKVLVLGCGDVGFEVASRLREREKVTVVDKNERSIGILKWAFPAFVGDFGSPEVLQKAGIKDAQIVIIATSNPFEVRRALEAIHQTKAEPLVLTLVPHDEGRVRELGASEVVPVVQTLADVVIDELEKLKNRVLREELIDELSRRDIEKTEMLMRWLKRKPKEDIEEIKRLLDENT